MRPLHDQIILFPPLFAVLCLALRNSVNTAPHKPRNCSTPVDIRAAGAGGAVRLTGETRVGEAGISAYS